MNNKKPITYEDFYNPEAGESGESGESGEAGESGEFISNYDIMLYILRTLFPTILTITLTIFVLVFYIRYLPKEKRTLGRYLLLTLPILIVFLSQFIYYSPQPRYHYFLSILYDQKPIDTGFRHQRGGDEWIFLGSASLEIDGKNYIFLGGGENQKDALLFYDLSKKEFVDMIDETNLSSTSATFSAVSFDMDKDGKNDLVVGRNDGVFLYKNLGNLKFKKIKLSEPKDSAPLAISISDYNKDGHPDIYISNFIPANKYKGSVFNDPSHNRDNILLEGTGSGWRDVTIKTKSKGKSNTFTSAWVDLNNDSYPDLVLSHDSSEVEILKNVKGKYFQPISFPGKGNWMGLGIGDYDNDGDQDIFLTNVGDDIERDRLSKGDIKEGQKQLFSHLFLRNDGNFKFVDIIDSETDKEATTNEKSTTNKKTTSGVKGSGFGWGAMFGDIDLDGKVDLLFSENFILNPRYWLFPGSSYYYRNTNTKNSLFDREFKYKNYNFGQTPLLVDFNQDKKKDIVWVNQYGSSIAYINNSKNSYLNVKVPETADFANAQVILRTSEGTQYRQIIQGGEGLGSNSSNMVQFGLGKNPYLKLHKVTVSALNEKTYYLKNPRINSTITLKEMKKQ